MKFNNLNFITSDDITTTSTSAGKNLTEVLDEHSKKISGLESNMKWIYRYGGVGTSGAGNGTGSGGGTSSGSGANWYGFVAIITDTERKEYKLDSENKTGDTLVTDGTTVIQLSIAVKRHGSSTYKAQYTYHNGANMRTESVSLNENNTWEINTSIQIARNTDLVVTIENDDTEERRILTVPYITTAFTLKELELVGKQGNFKYVNDVFITDVIRDGILARVHYDFSVNALVFYQFTDIEGNISDKIPVDLTTSKSGDIIFDLTENQDLLTKDENAAAYSTKFSMFVQIEGSQEQEYKREYKFNLIPSSLFLKVSPKSGIIYPTKQSSDNLENIYVYYTGSTSFSVMPYQGGYLGTNFYYSIYVDDAEEPQVNSVEVAERTSSTSEITIINNPDTANFQEHKIRFHLRSLRSTNGEPTEKDFIYYLYAKEVNSNLNWYPETGNGVVYPSLANYWRIGESTFDLTNAATFLQTKLSESKEIELSGVGDAGGFDFLFAVGYLYAEINDSTLPVFSIKNGTSVASPGDCLTVYPDRVQLGANYMDANGGLSEVYLAKTEYYDYDPTNKDAFHLLCVYKRKIDKRGADTNIYEYCIYQDGVLEGAFLSFGQFLNPYSVIELYPGNYYVNHLELSYFAHLLIEPEATRKNLDWLTDANIVRYYYTYRTRVLQDTSLDDRISMLGYFESGVKPIQDISSPYYNYVECIPGFISNISQLSEVPVISFSYADLEQDEFITWLNGSYVSSENPPKKNVSVLYANPKQAPNDVLGKDLTFELGLQGSTTRQYRSKNFNLTVKSRNADDLNTYVYTPNFNQDDSNTFLPESTFTLKADAVDSSHSNNTTMGSFINNNTVKYANAKLEKSAYNKFIKNCLIGFPVIVFVNITDFTDRNKVTTYYLGIYNFNLGRDSYYNLGYKELAALETAIPYDNTPGPTNGELLTKKVGLQNNNGFTIYRIPVSSKQDSVEQRLIVGEIQDNSDYYDFSLYDKSILFPILDNDLTYMFGDLVYKGDRPAAESAIQEFVRKISNGGGFIFESIGKTLLPVNDEGSDGSNQGYRVINLVPNYKQLHIKKYTQDGRVLYVLGDTIPSATINLLQDLIITDMSEGVNNVAALDYTSCLEYYVLCMAFGLLDSVQKNLNIKSWNGGLTFYTAFYDMDTCLGIDNGGRKSSYFAFSDYWDSKYVNEDHDRLSNVQAPSEVITYRDYYPEDEKIIGYDIPSSYLFAIAKYAKLFQLDSWNVDLDYPQNMWARLRGINGELRSAAYFIDKYFKGYMNGVTEPMFSYNYRHKYFQSDINQAGFDNINFIKFKGRRLEYVRHWIDGRLHILDAYFNLAKGILPISALDDEGKWVKVSYNSKELSDPQPLEVEDNPDIYVNQSVFGPAARFSTTFDFIVQAQEYSPTFIKNSEGAVTRYLLKDENTYYHINSSGFGGTSILVGGSSMWTYIDSINSVAKQASLSSPILSNIEGDAGSIETWILNLPSLERIKLTSPLYSGELNFNGTVVCPNLSEIDISNTTISLKVDGKTLNTLVANNCKNAQLDIKNCNYLQNVSLSGSFSLVSISGLPNKLDFNGTAITSLSLTTSKGFDLNITNDSALKVLTVSGYKKVTITNCPKLEKIYVNDGTTNVTVVTLDGYMSTLKEVQVNCGNTIEVISLARQKDLTNLLIGNGTPSKLKTLDLSGTKVAKITYDNSIVSDDKLLDLSPMTGLTSFNIQSNESVNEILFANIKTNPITLTTSFNGCANLERIYGNVIVKVSKCFLELNNFSIHGVDTLTLQWKGQSVLAGLEMYYGMSSEGRVKMPYEILGILPSEVTSDLLFQEGNKVTNMTFAGSITSVFSYTKCTLFDIYYALTNIGTATKLDSWFSYNGNSLGSFQMSTTCDNSPNRYMFYYCTNVVSASDMFFKPTQPSLNRIRLFTPTGRDGDNPTTDDGLFSRLLSATSIQQLFYSYTCISDRFILRRSDDIRYRLTNVSYLRLDYILDDVNIITDTIFNSINSIDTLNILGNLLYFFKDLPTVMSDSGLVDTLGQSFYINYALLNSDNFAIPTTKNIRGFCRSTHANGEIKFNDYIVDKASVVQLCNSFYVSIGEEFAGYTTTFTITEDIFNLYTNLTNLGWIYSDGSDRSKGSNQTLAGGPSVIRTVKGSSFPYGILNNLSKLKLFSGFFRGCIYENDAMNISLPGDMFKYNTLLERIDYAFDGLDHVYTLTSIEGKNGDGKDTTSYENFKNCPLLKYCNYAFTGANFKKASKRLTGFIPAKFFYHGGVDVTDSVTGTNSINVYKANIVDGEITNLPNHTDYVQVGEDIKEYINIQTIQILYHEPKATIDEMLGCFSYNSLLPYVNTTPERILNKNYQPFLYVKEGNSWKEKALEFSLYTYMWEYDGENKPFNAQSTDEYLDEVDLVSVEHNYVFSNAGTVGNYYNDPASGSPNFCTPPDLFRYCTASCLLHYMFAGSGSTLFYSTSFNNANEQYGMVGRICPYLLRPVYNVSNLSYMFKSCRKLIRYTEDLTKSYLIPKTFFNYNTAAKNLTLMFAGCIVDDHITFLGVFTPLKDITIDYIFAGIWWPSGTHINSTFASNSITSCKGAFINSKPGSPTTVSGGADGWGSPSGISFSSNFNSKYSSASYVLDSRFSDVFRGYIYGDSKDAFFPGRSLADNTETNNYTARQ